MKKMFAEALFVLQNHRETYQFPLTAGAKHLKLSVLKHRSVLFQLWRSEV